MAASIFPLLVVVIAFSGVTRTDAANLYQEKCTIQEGAGIRVDTCDSTKFLSCQTGRCLCNDIGNQIYDYVKEPIKGRSKRGAKKKGGSGGKIAAGAAVGFVAGAAVGHAASGVGNGGGGSIGGFKRKEEKYNKVFSCYGRVGSPCVLDYTNVNVVTLSTTTTTTTTSSPGPADTTIPSDNSTSSPNTTTTVSTPTTTAQAGPVDITKIPKCVRNAVCTRPTSPTSYTSGHVVKIDTDPRIGVCACASGYKSSPTDGCEKSGGMRVEGSFSTFLVIIVSYFLVK